MGKVVLIIVLGIIAVVLVATICGKNPMDVFKGLVGKLVRKNDEGDYTVIPPEPDKTQLGNGSGNTIIVPVIKMVQVGTDGNVYYTHEISNNDFYDEKDNYVGIPISHPGADCDGIKLKGTVNKRGQYDIKDKDTYNALTVNSYAITLGSDDDGFYGQVTNPKSTVYVVDENKQKVKLSYGDQFEVNDGTYVLVNYQWLYFCFPEIPSMPGMIIPDVAIPDAQPKEPVQSIVDDVKRHIGERVISGRKNNKNDVPKTRVHNDKVQPEKKVTYGFPLEEDDF